MTLQDIRIRTLTGIEKNAHALEINIADCRRLDSVAALVAQNNEAVYQAFIQEVLTLVEIQSLSVLEAIQRANCPLQQHVKITVMPSGHKSSVKCPKCHSQKQKGVLRYDFIFRSADEGAGVKFECLDTQCNHAWQRK